MNTSQPTAETRAEGMHMCPEADDAAFQRDFFRALLAPADAAAALLPGVATQAAFAVYRNTAMKACIDALAANFPTVERLVGSDWFRAVAARHVALHPPRDGRLLCYGTAFADFLDEALAATGMAAELPYLADVARFDQAWREAHAAADAPVLDPAALARLAPAQLARTVLRPHPAARWHGSSATPAFALWRQHRPPGMADAATPAWIADAGLLTRPGDHVRCQAITPAQLRLLDACAAGLPLDAAADAALHHHPDADPASLLPELLLAGTFTTEENP